MEQPEKEDVLVRGVLLYGMWLFLSTTIPFISVYFIVGDDKKSISFFHHIFVTLAVYLWIYMSWSGLNNTWPKFRKDLNNIIEFYPNNKISKTAFWSMKSVVRFLLFLEKAICRS